MRFIRSFFIFCLFFSASAYANEITHALGDTGYMIREAMQAKAFLHDTQNYHQAIHLQNEAKKYMHGTHSEGRHVQKVLELTKQAYSLAKMARDNALTNVSSRGE